MAVVMGTIVVGGIGMFVGFFGVIFICVALVKDRCRARWLFWLLIGYGPFLMLMVPWGTPFGIFFIIYALIRRREFFQHGGQVTVMV
jgi:hypothetical protein